MKTMIHGCLTALITPFRDGTVDEPKLIALVERQIAAGVQALVPCGTTGEAPTLSAAERARVIEMVIRAARGRIPVIAGIGSNNTAETIERARHAKEVGADAIMVVAPYYNKPTQEGLYQHFTAIADGVQIPMIIYNIPGRTNVDVSLETLARLAAHPNVLGLKDATGDLSRVARQRASCGPDFLLLSGDDPTQLAFMAAGGQGCISVASNVAPGHCVKLLQACAQGDFALARELDLQLAPLYQALFLETSPSPAKYALSVLGLASPEVRLPLVEASSTVQAAIRTALAGLDGLV